MQARALSPQLGNRYIMDLHCSKFFFCYGHSHCSSNWWYSNHGAIASLWCPQFWQVEVIWTRVPPNVVVSIAYLEKRSAFLLQFEGAQLPLSVASWSLFDKDDQMYSEALCCLRKWLRWRLDMRNLDIATIQYLQAKCLTKFLLRIFNSSSIKISSWHNYHLLGTL